MDTGVTHVHCYGSPPPVKKVARFQNPLVDEESDDDTVGSVETPPPPDEIDNQLAKQLDGLSLLLHSTFESTFERQCAGLPLPKELIESVDLGWVINTHQPGVDAHKVCAGMPKSPVDTSPARSHRAGKGLKSLDNIFEHRTEDIMIDSPRSVVVLIKSGFSSKALRHGIDSSSEARRVRTISNLRSDYNTLSRQVSQHCVVEYLRSGREAAPGVPKKRPLGFVSPGSKRAMREGSFRSEERARSESPLVDRPRKQPAKLAMTTPATRRSKSPVEVSPVQRSGKKVKPRNLARLLQHRDQLTAQWGMRQQSLVNDAYLAERVDQLKAKMAEAKKSPSPTRAPDRSTTCTPRMTMTPPPASGTGAAPPVAQRAGAALPSLSPSIASATRSAATGEVTYHRGLTAEEKQRRRDKIVAMKQHQKDLEERRRRELDAKISHKDRLVAEASEKRALRAKETKAQQQARALQVQDVNDRMRRAAAYDQLQLVRTMEQQAERRVARDNLVEKERRTLQEEHRQRNCLEYTTRKFVTNSTVQLEKMLNQQEIQARRSKETLVSADEKTLIQRRLKEESRELLKRVLKKEEKIITEWRTFDAIHEGDVSPSPSPDRARRSPDHHRSPRHHQQS